MERAEKRHLTSVPRKEPSFTHMKENALLLRQRVRGRVVFHTGGLCTRISVHPLPRGSFCVCQSGVCWAMDKRQDQKLVAVLCVWAMAGSLYFLWFTTDLHYSPALYHAGAELPAQPETMDTTAGGSSGTLPVPESTPAQRPTPVLRRAGLSPRTEFAHRSRSRDVKASRSSDVTKSRSSDVTLSRSTDVASSRSRDVTSSRSTDVTLSRSTDVTVPIHSTQVSTAPFQSSASSASALMKYSVTSTQSRTATSLSPYTHTTKHSHTSTPTEHTHTSTRTEHSHTSTRTEHSHTSTRTEHSHTSTPTEHLHTSTRTEHTHTSTPKEHSHTSTPTEHSHTSTPTEHSHTSTPTEHTHQTNTSSPALLCVRFCGRLGNELFEYASTLGLALTLNRAPVFQGSVQLSSVLQHFALSPAKLTASQLNVRCRKARVMGEASCCKYREEMARLDPAHDYRVGTYLQSYRYFHRHSAHIRSALTFNDDIRAQAGRTVRELRQKQPTSTLIGVHIRHGDMASQRNQKLGYPVASSAYINKSVSYFRQLYPGCAFVVSSDSVAWCRDHFPKGANVTFLTGNAPALDMQILSSLDHVIITFGTFSWWTGYLSGGRVVYMKDFIRANTHIGKAFNPKGRDYVLPGWVPL